MLENDLGQVFQWRSSQRIRAAMFSDHVITWEEHVKWFEKIVTGDINTQIFIFEVNKVPTGVVNLSKIDLHNRRCYWGFYVGDTSAPPGSGRAMGFLALEKVFDNMHFNKLCGEVLSSNAISQKYHLKLGFEQEGCLKKHIFKNGRFEDVICYGHFQEKWQEIKNRLYKTCFGEV
ncbi:hypothetical protein SCACP_31410 [Sporomusa carbonis]